MYKIYLSELLKFSEKRCEIGPIIKSNYLSSILKNRRLELSMTLAEATDNICSEAFLSKLERNLMETKNDKIGLLCERLNLNYESLLKVEEGDRILQLLNAFVLGCNQMIKDLVIPSNDELFIAQEYIVRGYDCLVSENYKDLHHLVMALDQVKECLCDLELFALLVLIAEYNIKTLQLKKALEYVHFAERLNLNDHICNLIIAEQKFVISAKMEKPTVEENYNYLKRYFHNGYPLSKQFLMNVLFLQAQNDDKSLQYLDNMKLDFIPEKYLQDYEYAKYYLLTKLSKHEEVIEAVIINQYQGYNFAALLAYNIVKLYISRSLPLDEKFQQYKLEFANILKKCQPGTTSTYHLAFIRLMQYELDKSDLNIICNYIKNYLIGQEIGQFTNSIYDEYIEKRYCFLLGKLSRYKDAYQFLLSRRKDLKILFN